MIDLSNKGFVICGTKGGGKSWLTKHILDSNPDHLIYDPLHEHQGYRRYLPTDRTSVPELERFVKDVVIPRRPAIWIIDEANRYIPPKPNPLPEGINDLNDYARHWKISCGYVCRRPVQFHTDIVELAHYLFIFKLTGKNDYRYLEDLKAGLGDAVRGLQPHHFACLEGGQEITVHAPIDTPKHPAHT